MDRSYRQVIEFVEAALESKRMRVGDRLPAERTLAADLGLSRASVREALRVLEAMGVIRPATVSGPQGGSVIVAETAAAITGALRFHIAAASLPVADVVRTRTVLESWTVAEAARRRTPDSMTKAQNLLGAMAVPGIGPDEFYQLDALFHLALAEAANNQVIITIMASLRESIESYVRASSAAAPEAWPSMLRRLRSQHRSVLQAITDGDPTLASRRVVAHIEDFYRRTNVSG